MSELGPSKTRTGVLRSIWHFIVHLRWHYQVFILSGGFLLGGFFAEQANWTPFAWQFFNVHLLLFGGATAYNSYWDRDEGPVGGLRAPPPMSRWMWFASLLIQVIGLLLAVPIGSLYTAVYAASMLFFWLYSSPLTRWKGTPVKSLVAIGVSTGTNSVLLGYLSSGGSAPSGEVLACSVGVALLILSLYPVSQVFQMDEDKKRGDQTFVVAFGIPGVLRFYLASYVLGALLIGVSLAVISLYAGLIFLLLSFGVGVVTWYLLQVLKADRDDYHRVMRIKYITSLAFLLFVVTLIVLRHTGLGNRITVLLN